MNPNECHGNPERGTVGAPSSHCQDHKSDDDDNAAAMMVVNS